GIGGGLHFYAGNPTVISSTIAGNTAAVGGGGIALVFFDKTLNVVNSTITSNTTTGSVGGGIHHASGSGTIPLTSTVVSGNSGTFPDIFSGGTVSANYSAIGSTAGFTLSGSKNIVGQNLKLRPLANNGGPTLTVAFESDSPLRGAGLGNPYFPTD